MVVVISLDEASGPKAWINQQLQLESVEPLEMRLSVLITKLHMGAADVEVEIQRVSLQFATAALLLDGEISALRDQASAVRAEMYALMGEVDAAVVNPE